MKYYHVSETHEDWLLATKPVLSYINKTNPTCLVMTCTWAVLGPYRQTHDYILHADTKYMLQLKLATDVEIKDKWGYFYHLFSIFCGAYPSIIWKRNRLTLKEHVSRAF